MDTRLYTALLGDSSHPKKSTAMARTIDFFNGLQSTLLPRILYGVGSAEGLARILNSDPRTLLAYDELRAFMDKAGVQNSTLLPMVTSLYERHEWDNATKDPQSQISVRGVHLSMLGCCTYATYERMWSTEAIAIGLPNRWFTVSAGLKTRVAWPRVASEDVLAGVRGRLLQQLAYVSRNAVRVLDVTCDALRRWEDWYYALPNSIHAKRLDTIGRSLLALLTLTTGRLVVELEVIDQVIAMLNWELTVRTLCDPVDADTHIAAMEEKARRVLSTRKRLSLRDLQRATNAHRGGLWSFNQAMLNLETNGEIMINRGKGKGQVWYEWRG